MPPQSRIPQLADRVQHFTESVIREMTRVAQQHNAINLGQGMPDFDAPESVKEAACRAIRDGVNQYSISWGAPELRRAISRKAAEFNGLECDPDREITVCCGATECMMASMLAIINSGDEVVIFQPFYENYGPDALLSGATPRWVRLRPPDWQFDPEELRAAFTSRTKAIILNSPNNPTGRVFSRSELELIADLCQKHNTFVVSDEIYEYIRHTTAPHISIATLSGMADRTITISGLSKTFSMTGWRLGYCLAPQALTTAIRKAHDFLTVGAPHPLQIAGAAALNLPGTYFDELSAAYTCRRNILMPYLKQAGFRCQPPEGAYYVMADTTDFQTGLDDREFVMRMIELVGVSAVPGTSFHSPRELGTNQVRFMFSKRDETLHEAGRRLLNLRQALGKNHDSINS
jgi:aminotransferase